MAVTLAQAKVGMADHIDQMVIDEFRRGSLLMDKLTFDNSVSPGTGGSTLVYGYTLLKTPSTADFREINAEYTGKEADRETKSVQLKIFGGKFSVDRVIARTSNGQIDEVNFQLQEKIKATINTFHNAVINGDKSVKGFDGLDVQKVGGEVARRTLDGLNAAPVPSGKYRGVFFSEAMCDLLGVFSSIFSAETAQKGMSLLKGRVGESIAAPCVTLVDDPLMEGGMGSRPFDDEGVPSATHTVVEDGVFIRRTGNRTRRPPPRA